MNPVPLNPCDYFLLMLDEAMRREGLAGNTCLAILKMDDPPTVDELKEWSATLLHRHPSLAGTLTIPFFGRPKWVRLIKSTIPVGEIADAESAINETMDPRRDAPFHVYRTPDSVIVRWHHSLMDAKGCEDLIAGKESPVAKGREYEPDLARHSWWSRVRMSFRARKMLRAIDDRMPANFDHAPVEGKKKFGILTRSLDPEATSAILSRAGLQKNLYFLSATFRALREVVTGKGPLVIPLPANLRKKEWSPVVANYLTFFHFVVPQTEPDDFAALKKIHVGQIRRQEDAEMIALLHLGRRLSLSRYQRERVSRDGRERVTSYFSYPGDSAVTEFLGREVTEYRSFPAVPARPGLGIFIAESRGRLLLTAVFVRENVEEGRVDECLRRLRELL